MKKGFKDPLAVKNQSPPDTRITDKNSTLGFRCPQYDERSSCFVNAGTHYGVGHTQPVGHNGNPKYEGVPMGVKIEERESQ